MEITKKLLAAQTEVVLFLITPLKIWEFSPLAIPDELDFTKKNHTQLHNLLRELRKLGVRIYNLNMGDDVSKHTRELDFKDLWGSTP